MGREEEVLAVTRALSLHGNKQDFALSLCWDLLLNLEARPAYRARSPLRTGRRAAVSECVQSAGCPSRPAQRTQLLAWEQSTLETNPVPARRIPQAYFCLHTLWPQYLAVSEPIRQPLSSERTASPYSCLADSPVFSAVM